MQFNRFTRVLLGNKEITSDMLDIEFDISFVDSKEQDIGELVIYNLSNSTLNDIKDAQKNVSIMAGYKEQNNIANIFTGTVKSISTEWVGVDKETTFILADGNYPWSGSKLNKQYPKGTKASYIMRDLINLMGMKPALIEPTDDITYDKGLIVRANKPTALAQVVSETKSVMRQEKGFVYINSGGSIFKTGFILNPETGLIGSPEDVTQIDKDGNAKERLYKITMLLNPLIVKGSQLKVESQALNSYVIVKEVKHTRDFNTEATVRLSSEKS